MPGRTLEVGTPLNLVAATISGVTITGTAGQFAGTLKNFYVGMPLTLSGTYGGTGSIDTPAYADPTTYLVSATNGTSTFTLTTLAGGALVTQAGTPTGITYTPGPPGQIGMVGQKIQLMGFYVNNTTAGTMVLKAASSTGTALSGTITPAIGWHRYAMDCPTGLFATLGGAIDVTFFYVPNA